MLEQDILIELVKKARDGDEAAKTTLIRENSPLIKSVVRRYLNKGVESDDLYQLGCIGFLKAINNFSTEFNVKFSTYAVPMISGEIKRFLRDDGYIKVSRTTKTLTAKINYFINNYKNEHNGNGPEIDLIAKEFDIEPTEVVFCLDSSKFPISIYEKTDDDHSQALIDKLASVENTEDNIDKIILKDLINSLDERERKIILLRYFRDKTQSEVAKVMNVSQVQISRLETKILNKIREGFSDK